MTSTRIVLGQRYYNNFGYDFAGKIGITTLHNRALTESELEQNFNATKGRYGI
jgi:hypothetical protein